MQKINVCIIGAGNISNTRHIPALKKNKNVCIYGVVSNKQKNIDRTLQKYHIKNEFLIENGRVETLTKCNWFKDIDAVVIGTPPREHYKLIDICLRLDKHVLVEKPMTMDVAEAEKVINLAKERKRVFCVMHNFQFASGMMKLNEIIESKKYGAIETINEIQFTNRDRRLPEWYNELPLGLFYDEAPHFVYLLERHGGEVNIDDASIIPNKKGESTPKFLSVHAHAGKIPVQMILNFNAPICEWYYIVSFKKRILIYDFFKDILINLPSDNEHYASDIVKNSVSYTFQYWKGFTINGIKMLTGNLLYGHDHIIDKYISAILERKPVDKNIDARQGLKNVNSLNEIVKETSRK
jgi:scyllo-inositol 2-dehydrogenase (NADP+)